jgi:hypothetical protein
MEAGLRPGLRRKPYRQLPDTPSLNWRNVLPEAADRGDLDVHLPRSSEIHSFQKVGERASDLLF